MALVFPCTHPLILEKLAALRSTDDAPARVPPPGPALAALVTYEATADLPTKEITVTTPLGTATGRVLADPVLIVPILRAGLGMADGVLDLIPEAEVWHIGL